MLENRQLLNYITFSIFTGLFDVGEVSHKTPTILAELLLKLLRSCDAKGSGSWSCLYHFAN